MIRARIMTGRERLKIFIESYSVFDKTNKTDRAKRFLTLLLVIKLEMAMLIMQGNQKGEGKTAAKRFRPFSMYQHLADIWFLK